MSKGKPCQSDVSLREKQQMNLDTDSATYPRMEGQSRSCHKHMLLLQVWCGLLTVAVVVMARFLAIKPRSSELVKDVVSTLKPDNVNPTINTFVSSLRSTGSSPSYIQLSLSLDGQSWEESPRCQSCSLVLSNNSVHCMESGYYFIYALVTFTKQPRKEKPPKYVILKRNLSVGKTQKKLVEGIFPETAESSVWVAKIVRLMKGDSISLDSNNDFLQDHTFWGAYQLH